MSRASRNKKITLKVKRGCVLSNTNSCCDKPAPIKYHELAHQRGECVADMDSETRWWWECYNCGHICKCEV